MGKRIAQVRIRVSSHILCEGVTGRLTEKAIKTLFLFFRFLRRELHEYPTPLEVMDALGNKPAGVSERLPRYVMLDPVGVAWLRACQEDVDR